MVDSRYEFGIQARSQSEVGTKPNKQRYEGRMHVNIIKSNEIYNGPLSGGPQQEAFGVLHNQSIFGYLKI